MTPSVILVNHNVALYVPDTRLLAALFKLTVTVVAGPPGVNVPLLEEAVSHTDVFDNAQVSELLPMLVKV
jgi:hypothetical protein